MGIQNDIWAALMAAIALGAAACNSGGAGGSGEGGAGGSGEGGAGGSGGSVASTIQFAAPIPLSDVAWATASGDLNSDGRPDLVFNSRNGEGPRGDVSLRLGNGDGSFQPAMGPTLAGKNVPGLSLGDIDGDSTLDIVLAEHDGDVAITMAGFGDGTFAAKNDLPVGATPFSLLVVDLNGDGSAEIATASRNGGGPEIGGVSVILGGARVDYSGSYWAQVWTIASGDFTGDGAIDLITGDFVGGELHLLINDGSGAFSVNNFLAPLTLRQVVRMASGDLNGDGKADLVVIDNTASAGTAHALLGNGDGTFTASSINPFAGNQNALFGGLSIADLNQDGEADLVVGGDRLTVFQGRGDGTFLPPLDLALRHVSSVTVVDLDTDGGPDIVAAGDQLNVLLNTSN